MATGIRCVLAINRELYYTAMPLTSCRTGDICKNLRRVRRVAMAAGTPRCNGSGYAALQWQRVRRVAIHEQDMATLTIRR